MSALHLALHALGANSSSTVQLPSYVCTALLNAIGLCQSTPKLIDNQADLPILDTSNIELSPSEFLIAPQMFGIVQDLTHLPQHQIIEDGAMALGPKALRQGMVSITSFYATKMMTTGQGGALLTDNDALAAEFRDLISYDNREHYKLRFNYAPTDLGSAIGRAQLSQLDHFLERRHELCELYDEELKKRAPHILGHAEGLSSLGPGLFRYWVQVNNKEECSRHLLTKGIESKSPVYKPLHHYLKQSDHHFTHCQRHQNQILSLPYHLELKNSEVSQVIDALCEIAQPPK
jgi:perosamine synthetase